MVKCSYSSSNQPQGYSKSISKAAGRKTALSGRGQLPPKLVAEPQVFPTFSPDTHSRLSLSQEVNGSRMTELEAGLW